MVKAYTASATWSCIQLFNMSYLFKNSYTVYSMNRLPGAILFSQVYNLDFLCWAMVCLITRRSIFPLADFGMLSTNLTPPRSFLNGATFPKWSQQYNCIGNNNALFNVVPMFSGGRKLPKITFYEEMHNVNMLFTIYLPQTQQCLSLW